MRIKTLGRNTYGNALKKIGLEDEARSLLDNTIGASAAESVGLLGDEGFQPGRYYGRISVDEKDLAEDRAENNPYGRLSPEYWKQQVKDRWTENEGGLLGMGVGGVGYRNADRIEDMFERRYARRHNMGMDNAANRAAKKGLWWSDWKPGKMFGR